MPLPPKLAREVERDEHTVGRAPRRSLAAALGRWPVALAICAALAAIVLVPGIGAIGLWEPQERGFADRVAPPDAIEAERAKAAALAKPAQPQPPAPEAACTRAAPPDAVARSLTARAAKAGRDYIADDDFGRRLPLVLLGLITVLATAGTAMRLAGARGGLVTAIVLLSMPLLVLQSRVLTSEIGTACGGALITYALVALSRLRGGNLAVLAVDALLATAALAAGAAIAFVGGGALLGLAVPIGAFAAAGSLGVPAVAAAIRRAGRDVPAHIPALLATLSVAAVLGVLAWQLYDVRDPHPGIVPPARQIFGRAIIPDGCWSWALGGAWRPEDDLRFIYDSAFEQIAYGTFPWGVLAPIAMAALLRDDDPGRRAAGALALAWAGAAWLATEAFQRKVGVATWAGFPALAIAVGAWLDGALARRARNEPSVQVTEGEWGSEVPVPRGQRHPGPTGLPGGALLIGAFFVLATVTLGKDMYAFADKITSLVTGGETLPFPKDAELVLPMRLWPLVLGALIALGCALGIALWRAGDDARARRYRRAAAAASTLAIAATAATAAFWSLVWQPVLGHHLSSKTIFQTYRELRAPGDALVVMGDLGHAPRAYADACAACPDKPLEIAQSRPQIVDALKRPRRVFAVAPQTELCTLHRDLAAQDYFVLEERNVRSLLLSNRVDGGEDKNPLLGLIVHQSPAQIAQRPPGRVVFDQKIELLGWDMPRAVRRGEAFDVTIYYKILQPVSESWKALMHFDGAGGRAGNADHEPIRGRCSTSTWRPGDYIIDRFTGRAGNATYPSGRIDVWVGFFTGVSPTFRNMSVSEAPPALRDQTDRVKMTTLVLD